MKNAIRGRKDNKGGKRMLRTEGEGRRNTRKERKGSRGLFGGRGRRITEAGEARVEKWNRSRRDKGRRRENCQKKDKEERNEGNGEK